MPFPVDHVEIKTYLVEVPVRTLDLSLTGMRRLIFNNVCPYYACLCVCLPPWKLSLYYISLKCFFSIYLTGGFFFRGKVRSSQHPWTDSSFIHVPCPIFLFPVSYQMHARRRTSVCVCVCVCVCVWLRASCCLIHFPKTEKKKMTTQTEKSERWLHWTKKTNMEGGGGGGSQSDSGGTETQRGKDRH